MRKGFTLVELSIVLVIIGLLVGGILVAQSMISTAQIQGAIRQVFQYDIATTNFETKYKQIPGDSSLMDPPGNNNGYTDYASAEPGAFWHHLSLGVGLKNAKNEDFQALGWTGIVSPDYCPTLKIEQEPRNYNCLIVEWNQHYAQPAQHIYNYFSTGTIGAPRSLGNCCQYNALRSLETKAIDLKIDDGLPETGKVYAMTYAPESANVETCQWGGVYTNSREYNCMTYFVMGISQK